MSRKQARVHGPTPLNARPTGVQEPTTGSEVPQGVAKDSRGPEDSSESARSRSPLMRGRPVARREELSRDAYLEECGFVFSEEPKPFWDQEGMAVEIAVELPKVHTMQGKEWVRDLGCFFVKQMKKRNIEVRERQLNEEQNRDSRRPS